MDGWMDGWSRNDSVATRMVTDFLSTELVDVRKWNKLGLLVRYNFIATPGSMEKFSRFSCCCFSFRGQ